MTIRDKHKQKQISRHDMSEKMNDDRERQPFSVSSSLSSRHEKYEARWIENIELYICSEGAPEDSFQHCCVGAGWMEAVVCVCAGCVCELVQGWCVGAPGDSLQHCCVGKGWMVCVCVRGGVGIHEIRTGCKDLWVVSMLQMVALTSDHVNVSRNHQS